MIFRFTCFFFVLNFGHGFAQTRLLTHLTTGSRFQTTIWVCNKTPEPEMARLIGKTAQGSDSGMVEIRLAPNEVQTLIPSASLGEGVAYLRIEASSGVEVFARYRTVVENSGWAHIQDQTEMSQAWQFFSGNPSQTWDGVVGINRGDQPTPVVLRQWNDAGEEVAAVTLSEAVNPGEKFQFVVGDFLTPSQPARLRITTEQPTTLLAIRGNVNADFLWRNPAIATNRTVREVGFQLMPVFEQLNVSQPVDLQKPKDGGDWLYIVEQQGVVKVFDRNSQGADAKTFLDISQKLTFRGEMGLLGLAFDPNYTQTGRFWVNYTTQRNGPRRTVLARYTANPQTQTVDLLSERIVLEVNQPRANHNGGQLAFGFDGMLYMSLGDSGGAGDPDGDAQNPTTLLGSILRLDVSAEDGNYRIPSDNPFVGNTNGWREELFAYGLRNVWRFSFDQFEGQSRLWAADVGQNAFEEINLIQSGGNYGWNRLEGNACYPPGSVCSGEGTIAPLFAYGHGGGDRSITGGYVYRGENLPELKGAYIYGDFISGRIWALRAGENQVAENVLLAELGPQTVTCFGVDQNQELYIVTITGAIYKLGYR